MKTTLSFPLRRLVKKIYFSLEISAFKNYHCAETDKIR